MYYKQLKKIALLFIIVGIAGTISGQAVLKIGDNPYTINKKAALDIESTTKGFLLPRMTKAQRDAIATPPAGLLVWCSDSDVSTGTISGELCVYSGSGWASFTLFASPRLTTGKKADANAPVRLSATSATIKGVLVSTAGAVPTETGIVWKEIDTDFATLPLLDDIGVATAPIYKTVGTLVITEGAAIVVPNITLTSVTASTRPYYFRTYAKSPLGIGYGNPVIFNCAPPVFSVPVVTKGTSLLPTFSGTLTVNAGTPQGTISEYGYCSGTTNLPTTANNKVLISTVASLAALNTKLDSEFFTADPTVDLAVSDFDIKALGTTYFRYYVIANGTTVYSTQVTFSPVADAVTGGTAIATLSVVDPISAALKVDVASGSSITVHFMVTKAGTYASFIPETPWGDTTGLALSTVASGSFAVGTQSLTFLVSGTPGTSLVGNSFMVPRIGVLNTGPVVGVNATCDGSAPTIVVSITSVTGKIWMDRNLGASRAGIAADDYEAYGCLYQWGRGNDGHASMAWISSLVGTAVNGATATLSTTDSPGNALFITNTTTPYDWHSVPNDVLWQGVAGINNPCPAGYRLPTAIEFTAELTAYSIANSADAYNSPHKFVLAGNRFNGDAALGSAGTTSYSWSSTISGADASYRMIDNSSTDSDASSRALGFSVRCLKD